MVLIPARTSAPPLARRGVLVITGVVALVHLVAAAAPGLWLDEAYALAVGRATEVWLLTGRTEPWTELWPRLRRLAVL